MVGLLRGEWEEELSKIKNRKIHFVYQFVTNLARLSVNFHRCRLPFFLTKTCKSTLKTQNQSSKLCSCPHMPSSSSSSLSDEYISESSSPVYLNSAGLSTNSIANSEEVVSLA